VPLAFTLLLIRLFLNLAGFIRLYQKPDARPIAVPIIETVDDQAQHEIKVSGADKDDPALSKQGAE
jgi:hypothetical protein